MIEDHTQRRHTIGGPDDRLQQREARVGGVHHEIGVRKPLQAGDERRRFDLRRDVAAPQVAAADAAEQPVLAIAIEILGKLRLLGFEVADHADDDRVALGDVEHPQVVFDPRAGFHLDRADDAQRPGQRAIPRRRRGDRRTRRLRPGVRRSLRAIGIEQVDVRVDDGNRLRLRGQPGGDGGRGKASEERASFDLGHAEF